MATSTPNIYQFKITLEGTKPPIWRRIQVPGNYNFHELHVAIQDAMGWSSAKGNYHLHQFELINPMTMKKEVIGIPSDDEIEIQGIFGLEPVPVIKEEKTKISKYFSSTATKKANYEYDFGDGWQHEVLFENILPAVATNEYPQCIGGERACPPEDCGGVSGFYDLLDILANPNHKEYKDYSEWLEQFGYGRDFNPAEFDPRLVFIMLYYITVFCFVSECQNIRHYSHLIFRIFCCF